MNATGTIIRKNGKFITLDDGIGYSVWEPEKLDGVNIGDKVQFVYYSKTKGDRTYNNIKGSVTVVGSDGGAAVRAATSTSHASGIAEVTDIPLARQRAIVRQTCVKAAAELLVPKSKDVDFDDLGDMVISLASVLEGYCSGDDDVAAAEAILENEASGGEFTGVPDVSARFKDLVSENAE